MVDAGWYPDPEQPSLARYWDGAGWTDHLMDPAAQAPVPPAAAVPPPPPPAAAVPPVAPVAPAAPSGWGHDAAPAAAWGTVAPTTTAGRPAAVPQASVQRRRKKPVKLIVLLLLVAGGAAAFLTLRSEDESAPEGGPVAVATITEAMSSKGTTCEPVAATAGQADVVAAAGDLPSKFVTEDGTMTQGQQRNLLNVTPELVEVAQGLPADGTYALTRCGSSWLLSDAEQVYAVVVGPDDRGVRPPVEKTGVKVFVI